MKAKPVKILKKISKAHDLEKKEINSKRTGTLRHEKIQIGAEDFASRFGGVMRELSNG